MKVESSAVSSQSQPRKKSFFDRMKTRITSTFSSSKSQGRSNQTISSAAASKNRNKDIAAQSNVFVNVVK